jgi:hypothetical protein
VRTEPNLGKKITAKTTTTKATVEQSMMLFSNQ